MPLYQVTESGGWSTGQRSRGGNGAVPILVCAGLGLLIVIFVAGAIFAGSYWGNPPREQAKAEQIRIENQGLEERQQIDSEAYRRQKDNEARANEERTNRALLWQDRWNEMGMVLAVFLAMGILIILGIRVAAPVAVRAYERCSNRREQLVEREIKLEEKRREQEMGQAERLREERRLEKVRLQLVRTALVHSQNGGNGREHKFSLEQSRTTSSQNADISAIQRSN